MRNVHDEARERRVTAMLAGAEAMGLGDVQMRFVEGFIMTDSKLTKKQVEESGVNRTSLTFQKVEELIGTDNVKTLSDDWAKAKDVFVQLSREHRLRDIMQAVEDERRQASTSVAFTAIGEAFGTELEAFKARLAENEPTDASTTPDVIEGDAQQLDVDIAAPHGDVDSPQPESDADQASEVAADDDSTTPESARAED